MKFYEQAGEESTHCAIYAIANIFLLLNKKVSTKFLERVSIDMKYTYNGVYSKDFLATVKKLFPKSYVVNNPSFKEITTELKNGKRLIFRRRFKRSKNGHLLVITMKNNKLNFINDEYISKLRNYQGKIKYLKNVLKRKHSFYIAI